MEMEAQFDGFLTYLATGVWVGGGGWMPPLLQGFSESFSRG